MRSLLCRGLRRPTPATSKGGRRLKATHVVHTFVLCLYLSVSSAAPFPVSACWLFLCWSCVAPARTPCPVIVKFVWSMRWCCINVKWAYPKRRSVVARICLTVSVLYCRASVPCSLKRVYAYGVIRQIADCSNLWYVFPLTGNMSPFKAYVSHLLPEVR